MKWAFAVAILVVTSQAWAADSDCFATYRSGDHQVEECYLCDQDHTATDCAELDLVTETMGMPSYLVIELASVTGCTNPGGPTVHVRGLAQQLGTPNVYASLTTGGTGAVRVDPVRHRHLDADVDAATAAGCTDLEVVVRKFHQRAP